MSEEKSATKTPIYKKVWFWVVVVLVIGCIGAVAGSSNKDPQKVGEGDGNSSEQQNGATTFKIGDIVAMDDMEVSVTSVQRNWTAEYTKPDEGKEYVLVSLQITNKSSDKKSYNAIDWKIEDGDGTLEGYEIMANDKNHLGSGQLTSGGTKKGTLVFEVPKDDKDLKIHYQPNMFSNREAIIEL